MSDASRHDALNDTNVEPSAAPSAARHVAKVGVPAKKSATSRKREELPHGERAILAFDAILLMCGNSVVLGRACGLFVRRAFVGGYLVHM